MNKTNTAKSMQIKIARMLMIILVRVLNCYSTVSVEGRKFIFRF
jgi:hypothetical protein